MAKFRVHLVSGRHLVWDCTLLETFTPEPARATFTPETTSKTLTEEAPEAPDDSTDEDCWAHEPPRMHGAKLSTPPNTFTCLRLRSTSSDSSHPTWDIDEKSGGPSAMVETLDRAEPLKHFHVLAPFGFACSSDLQVGYRVTASYVRGAH